MNILVIGGTEFIGRATVAALLQRGHNVTILNRGKTPNPFEGQVQVKHVDRRARPDLLLAVLEEPVDGWDAVVDFVAFEPSDVAPVIQAGASYIKRYIMISTDSVYEAVDPKSFVLSAETGALLEASDASGHADPRRAKEDEYGADKLAAEVALSRATSEVSGKELALPVVALRLPDVIGPHENTGRLEKLLLKILQGKRVGTRLECDAVSIRRTEPSEGATPAEAGSEEEEEPRISLTSAEDVATAVCLAVEAPHGTDTKAGTAAGMAPVGGSGGGLWSCTELRKLQRHLEGMDDPSSPPSSCLRALHVCSDEQPTWTEVVRLFETALRRHETLSVPLLRLDPTRRTGFVSVGCGALDNALAKSALPGWAPAPLEQRVTEAADWWVAEMRARFHRIGRDAVLSGTDKRKADGADCSDGPGANPGQ